MKMYYGEFLLLFVIITTSTEEEVGVYLQRNSMIRYEFTSSQNVSTIDFKEVRIGFMTKVKQGILMRIQSPDGSYISFEINSRGGVRFVLEVEFMRYEINTLYHGVDYTNNQQHEFRLWRTGTDNEFVINIQVDNYPIATDKLGSIEDEISVILDNPKYLFIGNNNTDNKDQGFKGCIYGMRIDNFYPLQRAFQKPRPDYIFLYPNNSLTEDICGFEETTVVSYPEETSTSSDGLLVNVTHPSVPNTSTMDNPFPGGK